MSEDKENLIGFKVESFFNKDILDIVKRMKTRSITMEDLLSGNAEMFRTDDEFRALMEYSRQINLFLESEHEVDSDALLKAIQDRLQSYLRNV